MNPFALPNTYLGSNSRGNPTPWNGNIPCGNNGSCNMNANWINPPNMGGNVPRGYPPTDSRTMSRENPTPPITTIQGGIPTINPIPHESG